MKSAEAKLGEPGVIVPNQRELGFEVVLNIWRGKPVDIFSRLRKMSFCDTLERLFGVRDLYEVLCLTRTASGTDIKRAYRKKSLEVHPDRSCEDDKTTATEKFQCLSRVYTILSDPEKRALYDESGEIDDDVVVQERDWNAYWRMLFKKITVNDIAEFEEQYRGSEEETNDIRAAYLDYEGNMESVLENMLCATIEDESRFREIIETLILKENLPKFPAFVNERKEKAKARKQRVSNPLL